MKTSLAIASLIALPLSLLAQDKDGFVTIFNGKDLTGWHVSAKTGHSGASKHATGGKWVVEDGAITGSQDIPGNGGIVITDEKFLNFEVVLEMRNDFGPDSGLFLRSTEEGKCYQAMIDYHGGGNLMGIYGEGLGGKPHLRNFSFKKAVDDIEVHEDFKGAKIPVAFPMKKEDWSKFWDPTKWNELRARITGGDLPIITTWINGVKFMEWTETEKRLATPGGIALQVHGGGNQTNAFVRYRNIRVKKLE